MHHLPSIIFEIHNLPDMATSSQDKKNKHNLKVFIIHIMSKIILKKIPYSISATSNVPLSSSGNSGSNSANSSPNGDFIPKSMSLTAQSKIETLKEWSLNTFKTTKQFVSEKFGKGSRTVDLELEASIESLRDTQRKYANVLRLARALASHFYNVVQTQKSLGESFSELAQKSPELQEEFIYNCETQRTLVKNGEILLGKYLCPLICVTGDACIGMMALLSDTTCHS